MKRAGIIGGLGPESTVDYYQSFIQKYQDKVGSRKELPELFINSINMYNIFKYISENRMDDLIAYVGGAAQKLEAIGADFVVISANTPHIVFDEVNKMVGVPMISIVESTYAKTNEEGLEKPGLLGTKFTMEHAFFKQPFLERDKKIIVPGTQEQQLIHQRIVDELENGIVTQETKNELLEIINRMIHEEGIDSLILGCTELQMILTQPDVNVALLDTVDIHVDKMIEELFK